MRGRLRNVARDPPAHLRDSFRDLRSTPQHVEAVNPECGHLTPAKAGVSQEADDRHVLGPHGHGLQGKCLDLRNRQVSPSRLLASRRPIATRTTSSPKAPSETSCPSWSSAWRKPPSRHRGPPTDRETIGRAGHGFATEGMAGIEYRSSVKPDAVPPGGVGRDPGDRSLDLRGRVRRMLALFTGPRGDTPVSVQGPALASEMLGMAILAQWRRGLRIRRRWLVGS